MSEHFESIILAGSTQLVTLNTRITQDARNQISEIQGWLQTARRFSRVSKQETVEWAIRESHKNLMEAIDEDQPEKVVSFQQKLFNHSQILDYYLKKGRV